MRKKTIRFIIVSLQILIVLAKISIAQNQTELSFQDLEKHTYYFDIVDNRIVGDGTKFLTDELNKNQYVMLGEYHGSARISEFTKALIPMFSDAGCRTFALEIGPVSAEILSELSKNSSHTVANLKAFNSKNYFATKKGRIFTPTPFFTYVEDAEFLAEAAKRKWNFIGLDQEFSYSYLPLLERMQTNLNPKKKKELTVLYEQVRTQITEIYNDSDNGVRQKFAAIYNSQEINQYLNSASENNQKNKEIAAAIRATTEIYRDNELKKYYANNSGRISYMKQNLRQGMAKFGFDPRKDKMLVKTGAVHASRGFSPLALYEIGNTLSELAEFNGTKALNIYFGSRFYLDEKGQVVDALTDEKGGAYKFRALYQMGRKDQWTIIDLRPLRQSVFYSGSYDLTKNVEDIFKRYDVVIIPKMEISPKLNVNTKPVKK